MKFKTFKTMDGYVPTGGQRYIKGEEMPAGAYWMPLTSVEMVMNGYDIAKYKPYWPTPGGHTIYLVSAYAD